MLIRTTISIILCFAILSTRAETEDDDYFHKTLSDEELKLFCSNKDLKNGKVKSFTHPTYCARYIECLLMETGKLQYKEKICGRCIKEKAESSSMLCPNGYKKWNEDLQMCKMPSKKDKCRQSELPSGNIWGNKDLGFVCNDTDVGVTVAVTHPTHCGKYVMCYKDPNFGGDLWAIEEDCPSCMKGTKGCPDGYLHYAPLKGSDELCQLTTEIKENPCVANTSLSTPLRKSEVDFSSTKPRKSPASKDDGNKKDSFQDFQPFGEFPPLPALGSNVAAKDDSLIAQTKPNFPSIAPKSLLPSSFSELSKIKESSPVPEYPARMIPELKPPSNDTDLQPVLMSPKELEMYCKKMPLDGNYAHPKDGNCTRYIECWQKIQVYKERSCPPCQSSKNCSRGYLYFDPISSSCQSGSFDDVCNSLVNKNSQTSGIGNFERRSKPQETKSTKETKVNKPCNLRKYVQKGYCKKYYICDRKTRTERSMICSDRLFWNPDQNSLHGGVCDYLRNIDNQTLYNYKKDPECPLPIAYFRVDSPECTPKYFYNHPKLTNGKEIMLTCPEDLLWSKVAKSCVRCHELMRADGVSPCCSYVPDYDELEE